MNPTTCTLCITCTLILLVQLDYLYHLYTGYEAWLHKCDRDKKSSKWQAASSPLLKKAWHVKFNVKTMLIGTSTLISSEVQCEDYLNCYFDIEWLVHHDSIPKGHNSGKPFCISMIL